VELNAQGATKEKTNTVISIIGRMGLDLRQSEKEPEGLNMTVSCLVVGVLFCTSSGDRPRR
jgi:hypothetical protein